MTFWPLTNSDFPTNKTFHQLHDLDTDYDLHRIVSGFNGAFATGVACQHWTLTLPDTWFRPPFWDLLAFQLLRPGSSNLPRLYSNFHLEYPSVLSRFACFESAGNCRIFTKDRPLPLVQIIISRPLFLFWCQMAFIHTWLWPFPCCAHHVFCLFFFVFINRHL